MSVGTHRWTFIGGGSRSLEYLCCAAQIQPLPPMNIFFLRQPLNFCHVLDAITYMGGGTIKQRSLFKRLLGCRRGALFLSTLSLLIAAAHAKRPELDAVYWGTISHNTSEDLIPSYTGQIVVVAKLDGVTVAEHAVPKDDNQYVLKIPMDDGDEPRIPGTVRAHEQIEVFVRNVDLGIEVETNETENSLFGISPEKGDIQTQNLSVDENLSTLGQLQIAFLVWSADGNSDPSDPDGDADGDGVTNFSEFLADTDPLSASSRLQILDFLQQGSIASVQFGPVRLSRNYTLYGSSDLTRWEPITQFRPDRDGESAWLNHVDSGLPYRYYRISVDLE